MLIKSFKSWFKLFKQKTHEKITGEIKNEDYFLPIDRDSIAPIEVAQPIVTVPIVTSFEKLISYLLEKAIITRELAVNTVLGSNISKDLKITDFQLNDIINWIEESHGSSASGEVILTDKHKWNYILDRYNDDELIVKDLIEVMESFRVSYSIFEIGKSQPVKTYYV